MFAEDGSVERGQVAGEGGGVIGRGGTSVLGEVAQGAQGACRQETSSKWLSCLSASKHISLVAVLKGRQAASVGI